ncbi:hypothetical protein AAF712_009270 [Marasmius tenuissimus]|uniref:Uncharacterized protein n=1 Tax=Marasmius tenuissimus TaxID=585030 RepID=A0ABR2ZQ75_9AGAR
MQHLEQYPGARGIPYTRAGRQLGIVFIPFAWIVGSSKWTHTAEKIKNCTTCDSDESEGETGNHLHVLGEREREAIAMTVRQLVNLRIVEWNVQEHDPPWSFSTIIDSLSTIPGNPLSEMNITLLGNFDGVVPLSRLPSTLRSLRIGGPGYIESEEMLREMGNAIRGNEVVLERLSVGPSRLDTGFRLEKIGRQREQDSLDILFKDRKKGPSRILPPSTVLLSDLALDGWDLTSPNSHAIVTQALKSLVLTDCTVSTDFWARLHASHVQLRTLRLKHVALNDGFFRYLRGYGDGLQGLTHFELRLNGEEYTGFLAKRFFDEVLPQHSGSLEELVIFSEGNDNGLDVKSQVGEWCFQPKNANAFAACHALRSLTVMMDPDSDSPTEDNVVRFTIHNGRPEPFQAADIDPTQRATGSRPKKNAAKAPREWLVQKSSGHSYRAPV